MNLCDGDMVRGGGIIAGVEDGGYAVVEPHTGNFVMYDTIDGYKQHDLLLAHPGDVFCPECGAESQCEDDEYPYVKMMHDLPDECERDTERFK